VESRRVQLATNNVSVTILFTDRGAILFHRSWIFAITRVIFHLQCRQSFHWLMPAWTPPENNVFNGAANAHDQLA
jgi:hypothetical protein